MESSAYREALFPYRLAKPGFKWWALACLLAALVGIGVVGYLNQFIIGDYVTGLRDIGTGGGAGWGLYIVMLEYFVGVGFGGMVIAALTYLLNLKALRAVSRIGIVLTVVCVPLAGLAVMADLGMPERALINLTQFVNPRSPFFGDFTLVIAGSLVASILFLFLNGRKDAAIYAGRPGRLQWLYKVWATGYKDTPEEKKRHATAMKWLALAVLPLFITAQSTLGSVFGIQGGRPGWFGAIQAPVAIVIAMASGVGFLAVIAGIIRWTTGAKDLLNTRVFKWLGNILWVSVATYLFLTVLEILSSNYASPSQEALVSRGLISGQYAVLFWGSMALMAVSFIALFAQYMLNRTSISMVVLAGILVNVAAVGKRYFTVVPSQTIGTALPYLNGGYTPTWVEWGVVGGLFALGTLLYVVIAKLFPVVEIPERD